MDTKLTMDPLATRVVVTADRHVKASRLQLGPWYKAHDRIVEIAKQYQAHAVADCGDSRVDCGASRYADACEMERLILPLAQARIAYWTIDGNHDRPGAAYNEITANSWLQHLRDDDLWRGVEYWNTYAMRTLQLNGRTIQVLTLPYPPRHVFATGKDLRTKQELDAAASEHIQQALKTGLEQVEPWPTVPLLILFHGTVDSPRLQTAGEARMPAGHDVNIPISAFPNINNCAVACGHIHKYQVLSADRPLVFYAGPLVPQEFDHEGMETGVVVVEFGTDGKARHEFVPIETIGYKTITVDMAQIAGTADAQDALVAGEVARQVPAPASTVVKVVLKAAADAEIDTSAIRAALENVGIVEPRIVVERPEAPAALEMEKRIHDEIGSNVQANVVAYMGEHPEHRAALESAGATEQDVMHAVSDIEHGEDGNAI